MDDGHSYTIFDRTEYKRMFKDIVEGKVNTIINKDKFDEVQNILDRQKGSRNSEDILLSYLKCTDCESLLYLKKGKNKKYYYCKNYKKF